MNQTESHDKSKSILNIVVIILLLGNIFFAYKYVNVMRAQGVERAVSEQKVTQKVQVANFNKLFVETVLNSKGTISSDDRIKLENDVRQTHDEDLINIWNVFVSSKDSKTTQENAMKILGLLANKMI